MRPDQETRLVFAQACAYFRMPQLQNVLAHVTEAECGCNMILNCPFSRPERDLDPFPVNYNRVRLQCNIRLASSKFKLDTQMTLQRYEVVVIGLPPLRAGHLCR